MSLDNSARPTGDGTPRTAKVKSDASAHESTATFPGRLFSVPTPIRRIFDQFPLVTYQENSLPSRAPLSRHEHTLYIFTTERGARDGSPSFNPACLRWQTYLKFRGLPFRTVSSSNHASPSGALPFLLPASPSNVRSTTSEPVVAKRLSKWLAGQEEIEAETVSHGARHDLYTALLENRIRKAWLYQLYINPANAALLHSLYVQSISSNHLVQTTIAFQLRQAAETELVKLCGSGVVEEASIMQEAEEAFASISLALQDDRWFFGHEQPQLLDASVFAYTYLLSAKGLDWKSNALGDALEGHSSLLQHVDRIYSVYYG